MSIGVWIYVHLSKFELLLIPGFLTLPTAYVTGNPVECVLHPSLWNDSGVWDAVGVGQMPIGSSIGNDNDDDAEFVEENIGYPVTSVSITLLMSKLVIALYAKEKSIEFELLSELAK